MRSMVSNIAWPFPVFHFGFDAARCGTLSRRLQMCSLDDPRPFFRLGLQVMSKIVRRATDRLHAKLGKALLGFRSREDLRYLRIELGDDRLGGARRRDDAVPRAADNVAVTVFRSGG